VIASAAAASANVAERVRRWLGPSPSYPADAADRRTFDLAGLELPARATIATLVVVTVVCLDWSRTFIPQPVLDLQRAAPAIRYQALERTILFGLVPLLVIVLAFRDRLERYGLGPGRWRIGLPVALAGILVFAPVVVWLASRPDFAAYYGPSGAGPIDVLVTNLLDLPPTELLLRGFLMFTLLRVVGPFGVVLATLPFVFSHLSKPEVELLSTFFGGLAYGWLDWRTGSIWWSALTHVALVTLLVASVRPG
jgi:membrane protease YdiL (CAAX protease family)